MLSVSTRVVYALFIVSTSFFLFCALIVSPLDSVSHLLKLSVIFYYKINLNYKTDIRGAGFFMNLTFCIVVY